MKMIVDQRAFMSIPLLRWDGLRVFIRGVVLLKYLPKPRHFSGTQCARAVKVRFFFVSPFDCIVEWDTDRLGCRSSRWSNFSLEVVDSASPKKPNRPLKINWTTYEWWRATKTRIWGMRESRLREREEGPPFSLFRFVNVTNRILFSGSIQWWNRRVFKAIFWRSNGCLKLL